MCIRDRATGTHVHGHKFAYVLSFNKLLYLSVVETRLSRATLVLHKVSNDVTTIRDIYVSYHHSLLVLQFNQLDRSDE